MVLHAESFVEPLMPGHEAINGTDVAFLIENDNLGRKALFDLGVRKDYWDLPPSIQNRFDRIALGMKVPNDVTDVLHKQSISLESINDMIWSHSHWDHTGDTTLFPQSTNLVYGPEVSTSRPGYPQNPKSPLPDNLFDNRENKEICFPSDGLRIGGLQAHDFYGDGSLYLLSTPGHAKGHLCALARTTPDTFILMGGDACHFPGALRPNPAYPMPDPIPAGVLDDDPTFPNPCPASYFLNEHPQFPKRDAQSTELNEDTIIIASKHVKDQIHAKNDQYSRATTPFYRLSTTEHSVYDTPNPQVAQKTVDTLIANFDSDPHVFVVLAHDTSLIEYLPTINSQPKSDLNDWYRQGWKEKCYWGWLNQVSRQGRPGRGKIVDGWWRDGKQFGSAKEMLDAYRDEDKL